MSQTRKNPCALCINWCWQTTTDVDSRNPACFHLEEYHGHFFAAMFDNQARLAVLFEVCGFRSYPAGAAVGHVGQLGRPERNDLIPTHQGSENVLGFNYSFFRQVGSENRDVLCVEGRAKDRSCLIFLFFVVVAQDENDAGSVFFLDSRSCPHSTDKEGQMLSYPQHLFMVDAYQARDQYDLL